MTSSLLSRYPLPPAGYPLQPSPFGTSSSNGAAAGAFAGETVNNESNKWIFPVEREFKVADKVFSLSDSMSVKDEVRCTQRHAHIHTDAQTGTHRLTDTNAYACTHMYAHACTQVRAGTRGHRHCCRYRSGYILLSPTRN